MIQAVMEDQEEDSKNTLVMTENNNGISPAPSVRKSCDSIS